MKALILSLALFAGMQMSSYQAQAQGDTKAKTTKKSTAKNTATDTKSGNVYVCSSKGAKAYHSSKTCAMLKKCKSEVKEMTKTDAESKGYTACKSCNKSK